MSSLVAGYVLLVIGMYSFQIEYNNDYTVAYLAFAFLCGYVINSVGSLLEPIYYFTISVSSFFAFRINPQLLLCLTNDFRSNTG